MDYVDCFIRYTSTDGDSISIYEALEHGVPVLATDVVSRPQGVHLIRRGDIDALKHEIELLVKRVHNSVNQKRKYPKFNFKFLSTNIEIIMKQIIQDMKSGQTILEEVPVPQVKSGSVLIKTSRSLVSLGTERMLVEFGKSNLIDKARQQPDKVKQVLDKIKTDGLMPTLEAVFNKLGQPLPLGYCNVGRVIAVGNGVTEFKVGDRVASNGAHAEFVCVPKI